MNLWDVISSACSAWLKSPSLSISEHFSWTGFKASVPDKYPTARDFLAAFKPYGMAAEAKYGIPWLMTATQAAHESRNGNSRLTVEANNLFGITGETWQAQGKPVYEIVTQEFDAQHHPYMTRRPFRKYADWTESLQDWVSLVMRHYVPAYDCATQHDAEGFFLALQTGGYATDPHYAAQLQTRYKELEVLV